MVVMVVMVEVVVDREVEMVVLEEMVVLVEVVVDREVDMVVLVEVEGVVMIVDRKVEVVVMVVDREVEIIGGCGDNKLPKHCKPGTENHLLF
ncbi:hypothetical protein NHX12_022089 [Muraenolepis orangiensis]|uniref:Uncharacterized protein n=1 Tax=Muraenolepis orangiensis TaxID=630683 RepID=A0A9Q0EQX5_9TELE|nr:hypothetical protein NHX12_022089 [Muraenolepis orangiensis]